MEVEVSHSIPHLYHGVMLSIKHNTNVEPYELWFLSNNFIHTNSKDRRSNARVSAYVNLKQDEKLLFLLKSPH